MIADFTVAVSTDLAALSNRDRLALVDKLRAHKPKLSSRAGRIVVGLQARANGKDAAEKQVRAAVTGLLAGGKVTGVEVKARG